MAPPPRPPGADEILGECRASIATAKAKYDEVIAGPAGTARTVANTLEPFNEVAMNVANAANAAQLYREVHPDAKVRDAATACEKEVTTFSSELLLDRRAYDALKAVDVSKADALTQRFAQVTLRDYKRAGVDLDDKKRARIKVIEDEVTDLGQKFQKNIASDTRFIEVTDPKRLDGLPPDWIAAHKPDAKGAIKITTDYPDYIPFIAYANDDELRKQLYIKFRSRGDAANEGLMKQLLALRLEKAKLVGFKDWAEYQSDDKMLRGAANAAQFIERITTLAQTRAKKDLAELQAAMKAYGGRLQNVQPTAPGTIGDWQKSWLERQVKKEKYAVDANVVRQYFEYNAVLAGLLEITSSIYDLEYRPAWDRRTWHPDVRVYDVHRKGSGDPLGRIFLDMHPREDKYKHAAQFGIKEGVAGKQRPEGALVCNFPNPRTASGPALMEHGDVVTMFHEFGHLMHHILAGQQAWVRQSGVATEQDFVEAPSQMFEEWGWSYETLSRFAKHHQTGEVIPKDLVAKMRRAEKFGLGLQTLQQMFYAALSLEFHRVDPAKLDQIATVKRLQAKYTPFPYVEGTKFHASFGHLVGYSSMYYTYMWSLVIAKDLLTAFEGPGLLATATTHKYRDAILAAGGTKPAADLVRDFLGRPSDFRAFEKYLTTD
ncbi:MAG: Zn-dependent oligopeptidase [Deltaproteobacteria bacterium]|nr:Zn-dependent oligopeptidase [Deltaproteobacteria bacterium]